MHGGPRVQRRRCWCAVLWRVPPLHHQPWLHLPLQVVGRLKPHTLVLNSGLWRLAYGHPDWPRAAYDSIFEAGKADVAPQVGWQRWHGPYLAVRADRAVRLANKTVQAHSWAYVDSHRHCKPVALPYLQGGRCIWKTTTYSSHGRVERSLDAEAVAAAKRHDWLLMDAWAATRAAKLQELTESPYLDLVSCLAGV